MSSSSLTDGLLMNAGLRNWTLVLLLLSDAYGQYGVNYPLSNICVVNNSTVFIPCTYYFPPSLKVTSVKWGHDRNDIYDGPFLFDSSSTTSPSKFKYNGDRVSNCSFTIDHVNQTDSGKYTFRFMTNDPTGKYTGTDGSTLRVVDLNIFLSTETTIREGDDALLECRSDCNDKSFAWFKNHEPVRGAELQLQLKAVSPSDSGNYSCSLRDHPRTTSKHLAIDVEYAPKNTSARPQMNAGDGIVSMVCSSSANPPVESYDWFIVKGSIQEVGNKSVFVTAENGEYFCKATNKYGSQNSSVVTVKIKGKGLTTEYIWILLAVLLFLVVITVVAMRFKRNRTRIPKTGDNDDQNSTYVNCSYGRTAEQNQEVIVAKPDEVIYTSVYFNKRRQRKEAPHQEVIYSMVQK